MIRLKQKLFCEHYLGDCRGNAEAAAIAAGYSEKSARSGASKLLQNAEIRKYIKEKSKQIATENIATQQQIQEFWTNIMNDEDEIIKNRLRASELLAKAKGMFNAEW